MKKTIISIIAIVLCCSLCAESATDRPTNNERMEWWRNAKFGMFIHWGIYSVPAGKWDNTTTYGEWIMHQASLSRSTYSNFARQFNPTKFNAEEWVKLAKAAGQKYVVITAKHHDGFAMFKSAASAYNIVDATPFKRDVIAEMAEACRKYDMKLGLYYSQAQDWYHPGGARSGNKLWDNGQQGDMMQYIKTIALPQVEEILSNYGDIAILWWDTPMNMTAEMSQMFGKIVEKYPNLITNNRLGGGVSGDLETPEQFIPATGFPGRNWEVCMTMNGHWGYNAFDEGWKPTKELIRKLIDIVSKGGNFLLNVGPNQYGTIPEVCQNQLIETGDWLKTNGQSIYSATASPFPYLSWGRATRNGQTIYLHIFDWPANRELNVPINNRIKSARLLADPNTKLRTRRSANGVVISLPAYAPDKSASVVAIDIEGEPVVSDAPSKGKVAWVSSALQTSDAAMLTDGDPGNKWSAAKDEHEATIEIDLEQEVPIQALSLAEPWSPWSGQAQEVELFALIDQQWKSVMKNRTSGVGATYDIPITKAQKFRLTIANSKTEPSLNELILYKSE